MGLLSRSARSSVRQSVRHLNATGSYLFRAYVGSFAKGPITPNFTYQRINGLLRELDLHAAG